MATTTSMQLDSDTRNQLAEIAEHDFAGVSLGEALKRLIKEYKINCIVQRYDELRADPSEWASYQGEAQLTDNAAGDGLSSTHVEYPEYTS